MSKKTTENDDTAMATILASCIVRALQPMRSRLRWSDELHEIFVKAVAYRGGPYEAKPTAVKQTMEAMGVRGLTTQHIKSHLQKYREKYDLGDVALRTVPGTGSSSNTALDLTTEMVMDDIAFMAEMEMVNNLLMDDMEMVENNFSVDEVQMMENELMNEIQQIKNNSQLPQTAFDQYLDGLANYAFDHVGSANSWSKIQ